jgi:leucyl/phenylalanyl-tRNA--protein transferase
MIQAYKTLHQLGHGHSVEIWDGESLVGGLYGVMVGKVFCGESMFHRATNASKLATFYLVELMKTQHAEFIDCQMQNPHLASLGCIEMTRSEFMALLKQQTQLTCEPNVWQPRYLENIA